MRFGDIFFRDFVEINGIFYMLDMRHTMDAGNECMAFYCNRQGEVTSGLEAWSKRGKRLTRSEFNQCKQDFIEYMEKKAPDAVDPYGCLEYAYGEDE